MKKIISRVFGVPFLDGIPFHEGLALRLNVVSNKRLPEPEEYVFLNRNTIVSGSDNYCAAKRSLEKGLKIYSDVGRHSTFLKYILIIMAIFTGFATLDLLLNADIAQAKIYAGLSLIFSSLISSSRVLIMNIQVMMGNEDIKGMMRFDATINMIRNAFYDLKSIPTIDELKRYSIYSYYCWIIPDMMKTWILLGLGLSLFVPGFYSVLCMLLFALISFTSLPLYLQRLVLRKPKEMELQVAIKALEKAQEDFHKRHCLLYLFYEP